MESGTYRRRLSLLLVVALFSVITATTQVVASTCSLADHIRSANINTSVGGCPQGTSHDIITLSEDITLSEALPPITGSITIEGNGHSISGDDQYRIFDVSGGRLTLRNLTLTDGKADSGGAIRLRNGAQVAIERSTFRANSATHGGAIATSGGSDRLNISDSSFTGNIAEQSAGTIYANGGIVNITGGSFIKNCAQFAFYTNYNGQYSVQRSVDADGCHRVTYFGSAITAEVQAHVDGGAIRLRHGARVSVEGSSFSDNSATYGGAISSASKNIRLTVNNSSFIGNRASGGGGAIAAFWQGGGRVSVNSSSFVKNATVDGDGGAIAVKDGVFDISNSTFSENFSGFDGGAIKVDANGAASITHATLVENRSWNTGAKAISKTGGKVYLRNSIVASSGRGEDCVGVWDQNSGNLSPDGTCADRPSDDPRLGELTGSLAYYPLRDRSPAIDYADPEFCLETDQLGRPRPQGGGCDIGAIEARGAIAAEPTPVPPLVCSLAEQIVAANRDRPAGGCPAGSGVDTIVLDKDITLFEALPAITSQIVIEGNGHSISGDRNFRIFEVDGGILTVKNLTMMDGRGWSDNGGAIRLLNGGRATVSDSRFINNSAANGGAVSIGLVGTDNSWLKVTDSHFESNSSGAIFAGSGSISVRNSSFVSNGGRSSSAIGVINPFTRLDVVNSSFINNRGGAISMDNGVTATLTHVTMFGTGSANEIMVEGRFSSASSVNLRNSIIIGKLSSEFCDNMRQNVSNLIEDGSCSPRLSGDPMLEEATDSAAYLEPLPGSPAINAADPRYCLATDQVSTPRPQGGGCDIGAIEWSAGVAAQQGEGTSTRDLSSCRVTTTHALNFRAGPGGGRIGLVPQGAELPVAGKAPGWFQVEYRGTSGWISADYVTMQGECE